MKFRSAKGQLPFVELNGEEIADSAVIIKELAKHFDKDFDAQLTSEQRNVAHATAAMLDNHLHWSANLLFSPSHSTCTTYCTCDTY